MTGLKNEAKDDSSFFCSLRSASGPSRQADKLPINKLPIVLSTHITSTSTETSCRLLTIAAIHGRNQSYLHATVAAPFSFFDIIYYGSEDRKKIDTLFYDDISGSLRSATQYASVITTITLITMSKQPSTTVAAVATVISTMASLTVLPTSTLAWLMPSATPKMRSYHHHRLVETATAKTTTTVLHASTPQQPSVFFGPEEEFDCPEEEECEIDWDKMPGFDDNNSGDEESSKSSNTETNNNSKQSIHNNNNMVMEYTNIGDEVDEDLQPAYDPHQNNRNNIQSLEKSRTFYEMSWQVDECNVESADNNNNNSKHCSDFCPDCAGSGRQFCKFCRGTRTIAFQDGDFRTCIICSADGRVECPTCRGTGGVAPWAATHDKHLST